MILHKQFLVYNDTLGFFRNFVENNQRNPKTAETDTITSIRIYAIPIIHSNHFKLRKKSNLY